MSDIAASPGGDSMNDRRQGMKLAAGDPDQPELAQRGKFNNLQMLLRREG
ncbi:MAG TPA: hypothetical protein VKW06_13220 [Candidatus Angelobacter sp.]|nr:hypothetical protein [Candidatus Angelobacter sp.]